MRNTQNGGNEELCKYRKYKKGKQEGNGGAADVNRKYAEPGKCNDTEEQKNSKRKIQEELR